MMVVFLLLIANLTSREYAKNNRRVYMDGTVIVKSLSFNDIVLGVKYLEGKSENIYRLVLQNTSGKIRPVVGSDYVLVQEFDGVVSMCKEGECIELSPDKNLSALFVGLETTGERAARNAKEEELRRFKW